MTTKPRRRSLFEPSARANAIARGIVDASLGDILTATQSDNRDERLAAFRRIESRIAHAIERAAGGR